MKTEAALNYIISSAHKYFDAKRIILFGSHAKNTAKVTSDFDLAFDVDDVDQKTWSRFYIEMIENAPTLRALDLMRLDEVGEALKTRILKEGKVIYARKAET